MTAIGIYGNNTKEGTDNYTKWLGKPPAMLGLATGKASQQDYVNSVGWCVGVGNPFDYEKVVALPPFWDGCTLEQAVAGAFDACWRQNFETVLAGLANQPRIYLRPFWEYNGDWYDWKVAGKEQLFIQVWQRFVTLGRSIDKAGKFKFILNPGIGQSDFRLSYPGDKFVDALGFDIYAYPEYFPTPEAQWNWYLTCTGGLNDLAAFAKAHNLPLVIPEFGVKSDVFCPYLEWLFAWMVENNVLWANFWDCDADYPGQLSSGQYPLLGATYKRLVLALAAPVDPPTVTAPIITVSKGSDDMLTVTIKTDVDIPAGTTLTGTLDVPKITAPLSLFLSEDFYQRHAIAAITLDNKPLANVTVTSVFGKDSQEVPLGQVDPKVPHTVVVTFTNDAYGGSPTTDSNLHVEAYKLGAADKVPHAAALNSTGSATSIDIPAVP